VPAVHHLIDRIAAAIDAPKPDHLLFDFDWNASVTTVGVRGRRVLRLGVPLLLALRPPELVALLGHELGHLKYGDVRRALVTQPARTVFGRLSGLVRPPRVSALELGPGLHLIPLLAWQLVGGTMAVLLFFAHRAMTLVAAEDGRSVELRADEAAATAAGTDAALAVLDVLAALPALTEYVQHHVPRGEAAAYWRRMLRSVQDREADRAPAVRQLSIRTGATLFASHPAPGRRHQWLAARPRRHPVVTVGEVEAEKLEQEIRPYAEALHRTMLRHVTEEPI
jgi:Zn-dependent protease with chaperone function